MCMCMRYQRCRNKGVGSAFKSVIALCGQDNVGMHMAGKPEKKGSLHAGDWLMCQRKSMTSLGCWRWRHPVLQCSRFGNDRCVHTAECMRACRAAKKWRPTARRPHEGGPA